MAELQLLDGGAVARPGAGRGGAGRPRAVRHLRPVPPPEPAVDRRPVSSPPAPVPPAPVPRASVRPVPVRPAPGRPACTRPPAPPFPRAGGRPAPHRVLARPVRALSPHIVRRRRVAATVGLAITTMLAVLLLGVLADVAAAARAGDAVPVTQRSLGAVAPGSGQAAAPDRW